MSSSSVREISRGLYDGVFRHGLFVLTLVVSLSYLLSGFPFAPLFDDVAGLRAGFRVAFGVVLFASLYRTRYALPILYGHEAVRRNGQRWPIVATYHAQFVLVGLLTVGLFTELVALLLLGVRMLFVERTKRFGLENTLNQMVIVHLPFLGVGDRYSLDALLGIQTLVASPVMFNSLFVLVGVMTVSGAYHKLGSDIWRRGDAVRAFLSLPHLRLSMLSGLSMPIPWALSAALSYTMILGQGLLLFSLVNKWLFLAVAFLFVGFSITMFAVVDLSYIGQTFLAVFALYGGTVALNLASYPSPSTMLTPMVTPFTVIAVVIVVLGLSTVLETDATVGTPLRTASRLLSGQNAPVKPFNEQHLEGINTFRFVYEDPETGERRPVLEVFDEDGWQKQWCYPRYFQASVYVVTDYCLAVQHDGMPVSEKLPELIDLCRAGLEAAGEEYGNIYLDIKTFDGNQQEYLEAEWQRIGVCRFAEDGVEWDRLSDPPKVETHPRLDFEFDNS